MKNNPKAIIFGCQSTTLTPEEREFFERTQPLGFILFLRNCQDPAQVEALTQELRACVKHSYVPILIDQEGGVVARLKSPHWREYPPAAVFGKLADDDINLACWAAEINAYLMGLELNRIGVNVNCAPMMDLQFSEAHQIMGTRTLHESPEVGALLGYHAIQGFQRSGIVPIIKHLPGHGRSLVDSHEDLPIIKESLSELQETDFLAFRALCEHLKEEGRATPWGMTAHIVYDAVDRSLPATLSEKVIEKIIRHSIGFDGFLITDCLSMKALKGDKGDLAQKSIIAGCDAALYCSGELEEMVMMAAAIPALSSKSYDRLKTGMLSRHTHFEANEENLWIELNYQLKSYWNNDKRRMI